jgi:hypothetical protein
MSPLPVKGCKFRPMFGTKGLWAGRNLYRATPTVTRGLGFSSLIRKTAPFSRLLQHTRGCGGSILTRILTGAEWLLCMVSVWYQSDCDVSEWLWCVRVIVTYGIRVIVTYGIRVIVMYQIVINGIRVIVTWYQSDCDVWYHSDSHFWHMVSDSCRTVALWFFKV